MSEEEIRECLERGRPGLLKRKASVAKAESHLRKAFWNLKAMDHNYSGKFYDWSVIAGYYAMYFASLGALWLVGLWGRDHACVAKALKFFFVEKGKLEKRYLEDLKYAKKLERRYVEKLEKARRRRIKFQYEITIVKQEDADWIMKTAKGFVRRLERLINEVKEEHSY